jgi:hypothetical protein
LESEFNNTAVKIPSLLMTQVEIVRLDRGKRAKKMIKIPLMYNNGFS